MRILLSVSEGPHRGRAFEFAAHETFLVGRGSEAHFRLPARDPYFSRLHFLVEVNPPLCRLLDMGSTNGTFVNGQQVTQADLRDGDCIGGGDTVIQVRIVDDPAAGPSPRQHRPAETPTAATGAAGVRDDSVASTIAESPPTAASQPPPVPLPLSGVTPPRSVVPARPLPAQIGRFRIRRVLGRGGMGTVYLAYGDDGAAVALKTIIPDVPCEPDDLQRFLREARILQDLRHPHIVSYLEQGEADGRLWFAMEFVSGRDAAALLKAEGPLPVRRATALVCQVLAALDFAHGRKFVHRDVKPENVLVTTVGRRDRAKLADFGLARVYHASRFSGLTLHGEMGGSLAYMAPEQLTNYRDAQPACDQFSAAATLYRLLTARYILDLPLALPERIAMILRAAPVPIRTRRADIPAALADAVHRALARTPADRFPSCAAFRQALLPFAGLPSKAAE